MGKPTYDVKRRGRLCIQSGVIDLCLSAAATDEPF